MIPLREMIDREFTEVKARLDRIESKLDGHAHPEKVSWAAFVPLLITLVIAVGLLS